jgi:hypothetical protein
MLAPSILPGVSFIFQKLLKFRTGRWAIVLRQAADTSRNGIGPDTLLIGKEYANFSGICDRQGDDQLVSSRNPGVRAGVGATPPAQTRRLISCALAPMNNE